MNQLRMFQLSAVLVVLAGLFLLTQSNDRTTQSRPVTLLGDLKGEEINRLMLQQGQTSLELAAKQGNWVIPVKSEYPADSGKVRSLLLKLLDLTATQKVPSSADNLDALGVADNSTEKSFSRVTLMDNTGKELGGLLVGSSRKGKTGGVVGPSRGQYVRRVGTKDVYLIGEALTINATPEYWLDTELLNVAQSSVRSVEQLKVSPEGETRDFLLEHADADVPFSAISTKVTPPLEGDAKIDDSILSQILSGIENLRVKDVVTPQETKETLKDVAFDKATVYPTSSGNVYKILSAEKADKGYIKIEVRFDPEIAKLSEAEVKARNEKRQKEFEEKKAEKEKADAEKKGEDKKKDESEEKFVPETAMLSNTAEAERIQARFNDWVFLLEKYQLEKFRHVQADLAKKTTPAQPAAESAE